MLSCYYIGIFVRIVSIINWLVSLLITDIYLYVRRCSTYTRVVLNVHLVQIYKTTYSFEIDIKLTLQSTLTKDGPFVIVCMESSVYITSQLLGSIEILGFRGVGGVSI